MNHFTQKIVIISLITLNAVVNVACRTTNEPVPVTGEETLTYNRIPTLDRPEPDYRGIISYDTYQILIATGSKTINDIANRLNFSGEKLALYNGLVPNYRPRKNEVVALPHKDFDISSTWSTEITREKIESEPDTGIRISSASNPLRHRIKRGETIYSIAREYNVSVNSLASWNGLGPDLEIKIGREIIIPAAANTLDESDSSDEKPIKLNKTRNSEELTSTSESDKKVNVTTSSEETTMTERANKTIITSENAIDTTVQPNSIDKTVKPFVAPVNGTIISRYSQNQGSNNNNGIDYETEINQPVFAAASGKVVLISDIQGGDGKIILIRHEDQLITIYGRLTSLTVKKGDLVMQGQKIGEVLEKKSGLVGSMHFEVREGMKSIDPETMIR